MKLAIILAFVAFTSVAQAGTIKERLGSVTCQFCLNGVQWVNTTIQRNPELPQKLHEAISYACHASPNIKECIERANKALDTYIELIQHGDAMQICTDVGLCQSGEAHIDSLIQSSLRSVNEALKGKFCDKCQHIVDKIKFAIQQNPDIVEELKMEAKLACASSPDPPICEKQVEVIIDQIVKIFTEESSQEICHDLNLC